LTELVIDAYDDLAAALRTAAAGAAGQESRARFQMLACAYRSWALAQPHRYRLLFGAPLPGYDAHAQQLVEAAQAAMNLLLDALRGLDGGAAPPPGELLAVQLAAWTHAHDPGIDPATALRSVHLEPPARLRQPRNRRELRFDRYRIRPAFRDPARHADDMITRL
jgi:hypothetical protein